MYGELITESPSFAQGFGRVGGINGITERIEGFEDE